MQSVMVDSWLPFRPCLRHSCVTRSYAW